MVRRLSHTTFDRSGHHAPHWSFKLRACLRGQSAVISSDQSNSLASTVAHNQPINTVLAGASALVTSDAQDGQFANDVAEDDGAILGHQNHPSTRNARSICAVAISMSDLFLVCAAFSSSSAAKSQCGRAWRPGLIRPTKRASSWDRRRVGAHPPEYFFLWPVAGTRTQAKRRQCVRCRR